MQHHTVQINQPTRCNNFSSLLLEVYSQLNVLLVVVGPAGTTTTNSTAITMLRR